MPPFNRICLVLIFLIQTSLTNSYYLSLRSCGDGPGGGPDGRPLVAKYVRDRIGKTFMGHLIQTARNRMRDFESLLDMWYDENDMIPGIQRSTQYTYEAVFGTVYWGPKDEYFVKNFEGRERFNYVKGPLDVLQQMIQGNDRLHVWCSDDFLTDRIPNYFNEETLPPNSFWDTRTLDSGGKAIIVLDRPEKCNVDPIIGNKAFTTISRPENSKLGVMILCPQNFAVGDETSRTMPHLAQFHKLRPVTFPNQFELDRITHRNIIFLFLSMLARLDFAGNVPMKAVSPPPVAGHQLFGWQAVSMLPMTLPSDALDNPALALKRNDWSTGLAVPMLPIESGATHFYQSIHWAYEALTRQGDPEHPPQMDWEVD
ncbi:hypothetical protein AJ78_05512 [Emergomyces pasteurianus Ep9510]|uniref:Uncharacterized protein n=1 Tax=Emergomyces pasteurianus Ep9510 TaxID=1447872 RepID=A0A1J9PC58_9EURO|nr:hypothetical protein AJ78_05512 [Emergomyces pasteurianus Ep9510]